jgi:phosphate acetyltransferase
MALPESAVVFMAEQAERIRRMKTKKKIVFPEGGDSRILEAAARLAREGLAEPVLIGEPAAGAPPGVTYVCPKSSAQTGKYADLYHERRRSKGVTQMEAAEIARTPLYFAALMVSAGDADGAVGGAAYTSRDTVRAALQCIGTAAGVRLASSIFIMAVHNRNAGHHGLIAFADCSVVIDPNPSQLADIAIATAESVRTLFETEPVVALLSYSTKGSGKGKGPDKAIEALRIVRVRAPQLNVDGEMQADAALVDTVGRVKARGSTVAGRANTLIFPDLTSANIGYKLVERLGDAAAIGPFMQGLVRPFNELSRGCSAEDVYNVAVITCLQAERVRPAG